MDSELKEIIRKVRESDTSFEAVSIDSINAVNGDGENMLHVMVRLGKIDTARILIRRGIDIEQPGDLGRTPLHDACSLGNLEMVKLLVESGADVHALDEGLPPFTLARFGNHNDVCDYLAKEMKKVRLENPNVWKQARIKQLRNEIARLEAL